MADPTRLAILVHLSEHGPASATEVAVGFPVTRQAVSKHLATLCEAGLVSPQKRGRDVVYSVVAEPLGRASTWLDDLGRTWDRRLGALVAHLSAPRSEQAPPATQAPT
jgi:DNA-binding transcriptional ArsR family regulator